MPYSPYKTLFRDSTSKIEAINPVPIYYSSQVVANASAIDSSPTYNLITLTWKNGVAQSQNIPTNIINSEIQFAIYGADGLVGGGPGGPGGLAYGTFVLPGTTELYYVVGGNVDGFGGGGGIGGNALYGGVDGGGASAIWTKGTNIILAVGGGGGGGGSVHDGGLGGQNLGDTAAGDGVGASHGSGGKSNGAGGAHGTVVAGGVAATNGQSTTTPPSLGLAWTANGGNGAKYNAIFQAGGGGGGGYGGGGGGGIGGVAVDGAGGGGGSNYINTSYVTGVAGVDYGVLQGVNGLGNGYIALAYYTLGPAIF